MGRSSPCRILLVDRLKRVTLMILLVIWDILVMVIVRIWLSMRVKVVSRASGNVVIFWGFRWSIAFPLRARRDWWACSFVVEDVDVDVDVEVEVDAEVEVEECVRDMLVWSRIQIPVEFDGGLDIFHWSGVFYFGLPALVSRDCRLVIQVAMGSRVYSGGVKVKKMDLLNVLFVAFVAEVLRTINE